LSYPKSYPSQSRAAIGPLGIGWARMSRIQLSLRWERVITVPSFTRWAGVGSEAAGGDCPVSGHATNSDLDVCAEITA
jgi:hypothetical protein